MTAWFNPESLLELARFLLALSLYIGDDEALIRTIMNRCYYAIFLILRERLGKGPNATHAEIYFETKRRTRELATRLDQLWIYRRAADYFLKRPVKIRGRKISLIVNFNEDEARRCIDTAIEILRLLQSLLP